MNNANTKTCSYLLGKTDTCQINLHLFFAPTNPTGIAPLLAAICHPMAIAGGHAGSQSLPRTPIRAAGPGTLLSACRSHTKKHQTIDRKKADSFKPYLVTTSFPATVSE
jgi:hypothetical protein